MTPGKTVRQAAAIAALALSALAQAYPDKPVQYVVPFTPGGESDIAARLQAQVFSAKYKQEMVVVNKAGAGGALAWSQMNGMNFAGLRNVPNRMSHGGKSA